MSIKRIIAPIEGEVEQWREKVCQEINRDYYNILDYNVSGDGVKDNTENIKNALNNIPSGGALYFPPGTYLATSINITKSIYFYGQGTIKQKDASAVTDTPFITVGASNVWIDGLTIDGNETNQSNYGATLILIDNGSDNFKISNCNLINSTSWAILGYGIDNTEISNNRFSNWRAGAYAAIFIATSHSNATASCNHIRISGNFVDGSVSKSTCISIHGTTTYPVYGVIVENNNVIIGDDDDVLGIELWSQTAGTASVFNSSINGNTVTAENSTNTGVYGISFGGVNYGSVTANSVKDCGYIPIEIAHSKFISVSANSINIVSDPEADFRVAIETINSSNCVIDGNTTRGYPIGIGLYSWTAAFNTNENIISNNIIVIREDGDGVGVVLHCSNASAYTLRNVVIGNTVIGNGTDSKSGVILELTSGTMSDNAIHNNFFRNLTNGIIRSSETKTTILNNVYETVTNLLSGTGGSGENAGFITWSPGGIGDGAAGNVQAPAIGTGGGPTTSQTIVKFIPIYVAGSTYYIPLMQ